MKTDMPKPMKTIRSYAGHSRLLFGGDLKLDGEGMPVVVRRIARPVNVPQPYHYSPTADVYLYHGKEVIIAETAQRTYMVFAARDCRSNPEAERIAALSLAAEAEEGAES